MVAGTCKICIHPNRDEIEDMIFAGVPQVRIQAEFPGDFSNWPIKQHTRKCLGKTYAELMRSKSVNSLTRLDQKLTELLDEAESVVHAAKAVLTVDGELNFSPRAWEMNIVYDDYKDTDEKGRPAVKTASLDDLLKMLAEGGYAAKRTFIKAEDARKGLRDALRLAESIIDKVAKTLGAYKAPEQGGNAELDNLRTIVQRTALRLGTSYQDELRRFLDTYSSRLRPDLRGMLEKECLSPGALAVATADVKPLPLSPAQIPATTTQNTPAQKIPGDFSPDSTEAE